MHPLISVIIPAYNVEDYIHEALESILNQAYHNIEVIVVNDGSTDATGMVCGKFNDPRVRLLNKENGGPGSARNMGLDVCSGELITFVDADDFIAPDTYSSNVDFFIHDPGCDILQFPYCRYKSGEAEKGIFVEEKTVEDKTILFRDAFEKKILKTYMPNKIFRRGVFKNIRFNEDIYFEDRAILPSLIENSRKLVYSTSGMYYYRIRAGQTTENHRKGEYLRSEIISYLSVIETLKKYRSIYDVVLQLFAECIQCSKIGDGVCWDEIMQHKPEVVKSLFSKASVGYKLMALTAKFFPYMLK